MTQGYGPQYGQNGQWGADGDQGQWGQNSPQGQQPAPQSQWGQPSPAPAAPQWGEQSAGQASPAPQQWSQASPPPAPGGYPGTSGYPGTAAAASTSPVAGKGALAKKLGIALLILAVLAVIARLATPIFMFMMAANGNPADMEEISVGMGLGSIGTLLAWIANLIFSIGLLVVSIIAAIQFSGRGRTGAIIVAATVIVSVVLYWIVSFVAGFLGAAIAGNSYDMGTIYTVGGIAELLRVLVVAAALLVGSYMVMAWGRKNEAATA
ncbi:hypothetical protein HMPREF3159_01825 [Brachybacterium sp. HMSC06H03]|uniref:hypothetical protein n=1 Tax=Brachybacterium sp. HMSC06H03 TaxID=1581127 RepID=UPI0008A34118|nr:hypothetical protein [Brachybacterium sp. HMSC06H03]OFT64536.1 hypothetical protein HMPREF3159_01825 [Brachybacterium sp. HMSC06H03]